MASAPSPAPPTAPISTASARSSTTTRAESSASAAISHLPGWSGPESRDVHPGSQMPAKYERLLRPGCRHDDVSASEGFIEIAGQCDIKTSTGRVVGKLAARLGHGVEDANGGERANAT